MSNQAVQKDEDLIILGDESSADNSILDFNLDFSDNGEDTSKPLITFGEDTPTAISHDALDLDFSPGGQAAIKTTQIPDNSALNDETKQSFSNNLFGLGFEETSEEDLVKTVEKARTSGEADFSFGESFLEDSSSSKGSFVNDIQVNVTSPQDTWLGFDDSKNSISGDSLKGQIKSSSEVAFLNESLGDRNEILGGTIKKLEQRKQVILQIKKAKQASVDKLNEQILKLKKDVSDLQSEIKSLEKEEISIESDIALIEKMKVGTFEAENSCGRSRKHNLSNIKK